MGESVLDPLAPSSPIAPSSGASASGSMRSAPAIRSRGSPSCRRAGPCRAAGAAAPRRPSRSTQKATPLRCGRSAFGLAARQFIGDAALAVPAQSSVHGQIMQLRRFGVQMVAPRSISAWAKSPARSLGHHCASAARGSAAWRRARASRWHRARAITRSTLPSTAAARRPKAMAAMAPAV